MSLYIHFIYIHFIYVTLYIFTLYMSLYIHFYVMHVPPTRHSISLKETDENISSILLPPYMQTEERRATEPISWNVFFQTQNYFCAYFPAYARRHGNVEWVHGVDVKYDNENSFLSTSRNASFANWAISTLWLYLNLFSCLKMYNMLNYISFSIKCIVKAFLKEICAQS